MHTLIVAKKTTEDDETFILWKYVRLGLYFTIDFCKWETIGQYVLKSICYKRLCEKINIINNWNNMTRARAGDITISKSPNNLNRYAFHSFIFNCLPMSLVLSSLIIKSCSCYFHLHIHPILFRSNIMTQRFHSVERISIQELHSKFVVLYFQRFGRICYLEKCCSSGHAIHLHWYHYVTSNQSRLQSETE